MDIFLFIRFPLFFILLAFSAFFSAAEVAFFSLTPLQIETLRLNHGNAGKLVAALLERPRKLLITIYIGNELTNVAIAAVSTVLALHFFTSHGVVAAVGISTFVLLAFGEISPKSFALKYAQRYALFSAYPLSVFSTAIRPLQSAITWLTNRVLAMVVGKAEEEIAGITEDEFKTMLHHGEDKGVIEPDEKEMILNVFELGDTTALDIMTPRTEIFALPIEEGLKMIVQRARLSNYSRIPVYRKNIDTIEGILFTKDLLASRIEAKINRVEDLLREPFFIPPTKKVDELLREFRKRKRHMAIIVDEYGGVEGLITLDDILEYVVGEKFGMKRLDKLVCVAPNVYQVPGRMTLEDFNRHFNTTMEHEDIDTIGGFLFHLFGRMPRWGESVEHDGMKFTVQKLKGAAISQLQVAVARNAGNGDKER